MATRKNLPQRDEAPAPRGRQRDEAAAPRGRYHHGDLTNALIEAATALARAGGPEAVVLRAAARDVGVSATAAYRHFASHGDLIHAVKLRAQQALADRMQAEIDAGPADPDPAGDALRRLRAIGIGYIGFALTEPGLFRTAFARTPPPYVEPPLDLATFRSYQLLTETIDDLVNAGQLAPARRAGTIFAAWSAVHGMATLLDGPLDRLPEADRSAAVGAALDELLDGISHQPGSRRKAPRRRPPPAQSSGHRQL